MKIAIAYNKQMTPGIIQGRVRIRAEINSDLNGFERTQIHLDFLFVWVFPVDVGTLLKDSLWELPVGMVQYDSSVS